MHVRLDENLQRLEAALHLAEDIFEFGCLLLRQLGIAGAAVAELCNFAGFSFIAHGNQFITGRRRARQPQDRGRH